MPNYLAFSYKTGLGTPPANPLTFQRSIVNPNSPNGTGDTFGVGYAASLIVSLFVMFSW